MGAIVVTTDLSDAAARAVPVAHRLAEAMQVPLVLLHVVHAPLLAPAFAGSPDLDLEEAGKQLQAMAAALGSNVTSKVVEAEEVVPGIVAAAAALDAELLVVASHGRSGLARLHLGSVAEELMAKATMPLVCVPATGERQQFGSGVIAASDLSPDAARAFPIARRLAAALSMPLSMLVVESPGKPSDKADIEASSKELGGGDASQVQVEIIQSPDTAEGIVEQARLDDAALVCTAANDKSPLRKLLLGSVTRNVVRSASFPVVVVPPAQ